MSKFKIYMFLALVALLASSCNTNRYVTIDSLSKLGDTYYSNQQVPVWVCVETSDFTELEYKWECDGGSFYGPTDVVRAVWVAPSKKGDYTIRCTVSCGRKEDTRTATMSVTDFFVDDFGSDTSAGYTTSNVTTEWSSTNNEMELSVAAAKTASFAQTFSDDTFNYPFTFSSDFAWRSTFTSGKAVTMTLTFNRPDDNRATYLKAIYFKLLPTAEQDDTDPSTGYYLKNVQAYAQIYTVTFNRTVEVELANSYLSSMMFSNGAYTPDSRGMRNIKMEIFSDYTVVGTADSATEGGDPIEFCRSTALGEYLTANNLEQVLNLSQFAIGAEGECLIYLDNIHLNQIDE